MISMKRETVTIVAIIGILAVMGIIFSA